MHLGEPSLDVREALVQLLGEVDHAALAFEGGGALTLCLARQLLTHRLDLLKRSPDRVAKLGRLGNVHLEVELSTHAHNQEHGLGR